MKLRANTERGWKQAWKRLDDYGFPQFLSTNDPDYDIGILDIFIGKEVKRASMRRLQRPWERMNDDKKYGSG